MFKGVGEVAAHSLLFVLALAFSLEQIGERHRVRVNFLVALIDFRRLFLTATLLGAAVASVALFVPLFVGGAVVEQEDKSLGAAGKGGGAAAVMLCVIPGATGTGGA